MRANRLRALRRLDQLKEALHYVPITTQVMLLAADYWAEARNRGRPTADDKALDGDMILVAQTTLLARTEQAQVTIATTNVGHLSLFTQAQRWRDITA